jgi:hypothetical protein
MEAKLGRELYFETPDKKGVLADICVAFANANINIEAMCAYGQGGKGYFMMLTSDNIKAIEVLKTLGYKAKENDVLVLTLKNKVGVAAKIGKRLADANINIRYTYGSASQDGKSFVLVMSTNKIDEALEALSALSNVEA